MSYTFFTITAPDGNDPRTWASRMWDTYGFDYNTDMFGEDTVCAWALENDAELESALRDDGIEFSTFEVDDLDTFFGLS